MVTPPNAVADPEATLVQRAYGMLAGVAVGDALGMPGEFLTRETIEEWYGGITDLRTADPRHPHHRLPAGSVTDDTDHTLLLADLLLTYGEIEPRQLAQRLLEWGTSPRVMENRFVGPSTLKTLAALKDGAALDEIPRGGTSSGAAMRVAALAIALADRDSLAEQVVASCAVSHYTRAAIAGAMAMAFALSAALEPDASGASIAAAAKVGAGRGLEHGAWCWTAPLDKRIDHVLEWTRTLSRERVLANLFELIGVDMYGEQLVPDAIALMVLAQGDPNEAMIMAANLGGDSDTLASMAGSLCGALKGVQAVEAGWLDRVEAINDLQLGVLAERLVGHRLNGLADSC